MGLLGKLLGADITSPIKAIGNVLDKVTTTDEERAAADITLAKLVAESDSLQTELNRVESQHRSLFVAGWRPAIGWVGAISLALYFIPQYIVATWMWTSQWIETGEIGPYPISPEGLLELVLGMLGIGAFRMVEKLNGRAK